MRAYISGPMTDTEDYEAAFRKAARYLRKKGLDVVNPAELDDLEHGELSYEEYLARDIVEILSCDALVLLDGWEQSRGAKLEYALANLLKLPVSHIKEL